MEGVMSDVNSGDILRLGGGLSFEGVYDVVNVWHVLAEHASGDSWPNIVPQLQDYMNNLYGDLKTPLNDQIGDNVITVANVTQDTTIGAIDWSPGWAGAESGESTAPGVCCFAWIRTYTPRVQIRKYFGVFGEANIVAGLWHSNVLSACTAAMEYHREPHFIGGGWTFTGVAYNRDLGTYVMGVSSDSAPEPAYQRRRKRGRGS
jgi:hypothetical protein